MLTWATSIVFGVFLLLAVVLNLMANNRRTSTSAKAPRDESAPRGIAAGDSADAERQSAAVGRSLRLIRSDEP